MGRNYDKSLAALARSLFFYGTLIVVSKDIVVNGMPGRKLPFLGYTFPLTSLPSFSAVTAFCVITQPFCYHLMVSQGSCYTARKRNLFRWLYLIGRFKREDIWLKKRIAICVVLQ